MKKWRIYTGLALLWLCALGTRAQYDPSLTHYWMLQPQYNPAAAGTTEYLRVIGAYSAQMSGYDDAPATMYAGVDLPMFFVNPRHGLGLSFLNDEIGLFSHKRFSLQYAYRFKLFGGQLGFGVQGDMLNETFDGSKVDLEKSEDDVFATSEVNGSKIDAAFGLWYDHKNWYVGLSSQHLTAPTVKMGEKNQIKVERSYYFTAGYNIQLRNPLLSIHPTAFATYDGTGYKAIVSARLEYNNDTKQLFAGGSYSPEHSAALFVGGRFHGVVLSYSYEAYTSGVGLEHGAHEVVLSYQHKLDLYKKGKNRHKSVRWL